MSKPRYEDMTDDELIAIWKRRAHDLRWNGSAMEGGAMARAIEECAMELADRRKHGWDPGGAK